MQRTVLIATGSLSLTQGDTLTVGGTGYTVTDLLRDGPDGRLTRVLLSRVESFAVTADLATSGLSAAAVMAVA
jgi:hypothetical protein